MKPINEKIRELRKAKGLTQEALGAKLGISGQAVAKWEKGESMPDILLLPDLCRLLGTSADALLEVPSQKAAYDGFIHVNVVDESGEWSRMRFELNGTDYAKHCMTLDHGEVAWYLSVLTNETTFRVLCAIPIEEKKEEAVTEADICVATGLSAAEVTRSLRVLLKRNLIREIESEKRSATSDFVEPRYLLEWDEMVGIYMVLSGCCMGGCDQKGKKTTTISNTTHSDPRSIFEEIEPFLK